MIEPPRRPSSQSSFIAPPKCPKCNGMKTDAAGSKCHGCNGVGHVSLERHQEMLFELAKDGIEINIHDTDPPDTLPDPNRGAT